MIRIKAGAMAPALLLIVATCGSAAAAFAGTAPIPVRQACDAYGRCYETGDYGYRDDDAPPPQRRYDPEDDDRPPPPRYRRYDPDNEPPPPPRRRYYRDDDEN